MSRVLSDENLALLKAVREQQPDSMDTLAQVVGKHAANVSRSMHTMAEFGLVEFIKNGRTVTSKATFEHLSVDFCWLYGTVERLDGLQRGGQAGFGET